MAKKKDSQLELEVKDTKFDLDSLKDELKDYITLEIKKEFNDEVERVNKKLIKEKSRSILWKNIFIVILILIIGFLLYLMYNDGYFNRLFNKENTSNSIVEEDNNKEEPIEKEEKPEEEPKEEVKKPTLEELKKEYASLLDNIYINEESEYLTNYYQGVLSNELKNYLVLNLVDFDALSKEDDCNIIDNDTIKNKYNLLFNDTYNSGNFSYNGNKIRYISKIDSYITSSLLEKKKTNIKREIINITLDEEKVIIETVEGLVKDNYIYNILTDEKYEESELLTLKDKLTHVTYTFKNDNLIDLNNPNLELKD